MGVLSGLTLHALDNQTLTSVLQSPVRKHRLCVRRQPSHVPLFNPPVFPSSQPCPPLQPMDAQCLSPAESLPRSLGSGRGGVRHLEAAQAPPQEGCIVLQNLICHYVMVGVNQHVTLAFHLRMYTCQGGGGG